MRIFTLTDDGERRPYVLQASQADVIYLLRAVRIARDVSASATGPLAEIELRHTERLLAELRAVLFPDLTGGDWKARDSGEGCHARTD